MSYFISYKYGQFKFLLKIYENLAQRATCERKIAVDTF